MEMGLLPNKAKTARRVIEILEYFDDNRNQATVMDIARRYDAPQSSTSELLAILVEMGLLYKDSITRCYAPTPRAAMLGSLFQPSAVRDGRLAMLTDRLVAQTGLGVALTGMVGLNVQLFRWMSGIKPVATTAPNSLSSGFQKRLCDSAAGWLLLSTLPTQKCEAMIRRMRAEAGADNKFDVSELMERVRNCGQQGYAIGSAGFGTTAEMCTILLPKDADDRPMALGFIYEPSREIDPNALIALLEKSAQTCATKPDNAVSLRGHDAVVAVPSVA
jgi:DNA-binding IclR family transcriptional regulator